MRPPLTDPYDSYIVLYEHDAYGGATLTIPLRRGAVAILHPNSLLFAECSSFELFSATNVRIRVHGSSDHNQRYRDYKYPDTDIRQEFLRDWSGDYPINDAIVAVSWAIDESPPVGVPAKWIMGREDDDNPPRRPQQGLPPPPADMYCGLYYKKEGEKKSLVAKGLLFADSRSAAKVKAIAHAAGDTDLQPPWVNFIDVNPGYCPLSGRDLGYIG